MAKSPSFRAVEKLGIEYPNLDKALKEDPLFQYAYDPKMLVQYFGGNPDMSLRGIAGLYGYGNFLNYLPKNMKEEVERRGLVEEMVYADPEVKKEPVSRATKNLTNKEKEIVADYLSNLPKEDTIQHEFLHRAFRMMDYDGFIDDHELIYSKAIDKAPDNIKPVLEKYYEALYTNENFPEASLKFDKTSRERNAKIMKSLEKKAGSLMDKPLYENE